MRASISKVKTAGLSIDESTRLVELERKIEHGFPTFIEVGEALMEIRDSRLYRGEHRTFEDYCRLRLARREPASFFLLVNIRRLKLPTKPENETIKMKHREPEYNIYSAKAGWKNLISRGEWASWIKVGKRGSINQIVGWFGTSGKLSWIMVSTGPSNRWQCAAGEWESLVLDHFEIDLVNPSYCRGSVKEIEAMHGRAVSNARKWLRNYVERPIHYSENILTRADPLHWAKSPDFEVNYYEELELSTKELEDLFRHTKTSGDVVHRHRQGQISNSTNGNGAPQRA